MYFLPLMASSALASSLARMPGGQIYTLSTSINEVNGEIAQKLEEIWSTEKGAFSPRLSRANWTARDVECNS